MVIDTNNTINTASPPAVASANSDKNGRTSPPNPQSRDNVQAKPPLNDSWQVLSNIRSIFNNPIKLLSAQTKLEMQGIDSIKDINFDPADPSQFILNAFDDERFKPVMDKVIGWAADYLRLKEATEESRTKILDKLIQIYKANNLVLNKLILTEGKIGRAHV
jgi:hypothetical protein